MKKITTLILITAIFFGLANFALAQEKPKDDSQIEVNFFYGITCPHCKKAHSFLEKLDEKYPQLKLNAYEVYANKENAQLLLDLYELHGQGRVIRVPATFIKDKVIIGYLNDETTGQLIEKTVEECLAEICPEEEQDQIVDYPLIGKINLSQLSLPVLTVAVAALDGFNPCAMWVLLFLIALLINIRSRKKIWLVGGTFILVSGIIYYLLLTAWLNLFLAISYISLTRIIIGLLALGVGIWQIKKFFTFKPGLCEVAPVGSKWHQRITNKAKQVVQSNTLPVTFVGIVILAFGVNLIEFFCSAGLPAIYTHILTLSQLNPLAYYLYLLLYTFIFMLDDLIIFAIAIITLSRIGFTEKYQKWSTLVGGLLILILGLLLIFKPDFLVFG